MFKVGIIGPESCGKTTLCRYLSRRYHTPWIPEYARTYLETQPSDYLYTRTDVENIARHQIQQLQQLHKTTNWGLTPLGSFEVIFFDTELIITKVWFLRKYGECPTWLEEAVRQYPMDTYLLCYPDLPWQPDPLRENPHIRLELFEQYEREIQTLNRPYYIIKHTTETP